MPTKPVEFDSSAIGAPAQPDRLAIMATLYGLAPAQPSVARVLELRCGDGAHLQAMAARYRGAHFVGIETDRLLIEQARRSSEALRLSNVEFTHLEVEKLGSARFDEPFDYIICHDLFSALRPSQQAALLRLCRESLAPDGVAYVGYDTYPGWKMREVVRDAMRFNVRGVDHAALKLAHGRAMLQWLDENAHAKTAYGRMLVNEASRIAGWSDARLFGESFERECHPCYFSEFVARARQQRLALLGEANFSEQAVHQRGKKLAAALGHLAGEDWVGAEQCLDFLRNRTSRQTLLVHAHAAASIDRSPRSGLLTRMHSSCDYEQAPMQSPYEQEREFRSPTGRTIRTENLVMQAMLQAWAQAFPHSLGFDELLAATQHRRFGQHQAPTRDEVAETMLRFAREGVVQLHVEAVVAGRARDRRPRAFEPARVAAAIDQSIVWNLRLEPVGITPGESTVLAMLDGTLDAVELRERLVAMAERGAIDLRRDESEPSHEGGAEDESAANDAGVAGERRAAAAALVRRALRRFEHAALLSAGDGSADSDAARASSRDSAPTRGSAFPAR